MNDKRSAEKLPEHGAKKARRSITVEKKLEVIRRIEAGQTRPNVCKSMNLPPSTVTTIMKNADRIKQTMTVNAKHVTYSRGKLYEKMEKLLSLWIDDSNEKNIPLTQGVITEKAKTIFQDLKSKDGGEETFLGSKGWYVRFKSRSMCNSVKTCASTEDPVLSDKETKYKALPDITTEEPVNPLALPIAVKQELIDSVVEANISDGNPQHNNINLGISEELIITPDIIKRERNNEVEAKNICSTSGTNVEENVDIFLKYLGSKLKRIQNLKIYYEVENKILKVIQDTENLIYDTNS